MYKTKNMEKWIGYHFELIGCKPGKDFSNFSRNLKAELTAQIREKGCELVSYNKGYFYISGFVYNCLTEKYMYFSVGDVRYEKNWKNRILVREAKNEKDYTGGVNQWTSLENFGLAVEKILCVRKQQRNAA